MLLRAQLRRAGRRAALPCWPRRRSSGGGFASLVGEGRVAGAQFHPERSGAAGAEFLRARAALGGAMLRRRIIPCLDVSGGRVVKGVNFVNLRDCGDPVEAALRYAEQGADEIVWLNITADGRGSWRALLAPVERAAEQIDVPLTVGGGVNRVGRVRELLLAGADKVSLNTGGARAARA